MSIRRLFLFLLVAVAFLIATGLQTTSLGTDGNSNNETGIIAGRNVNMVSGTMLPLGDPWVQRQNEPSIAVSSRNPMHLFAAANDYRTIDMPHPYEVRGIPGVSAGRDAWIGVFESFDGGESWVTMLLPGFPQDASNEGSASPIYGFDTACDPKVCAGAEGLFYLSGIAFMRNQLAGVVFVARYVDNNNRENVEEVIDPISEQRRYESPIEYVDTRIAGIGNPGQFIDMPNMAVDVPRGDAPYGNVYLAYTVFLGNTGLNIRSRIVFVTSTDGGMNWSKAIKLTESQHIVQRPVIAIDPNDSTGNTIYVVFRRFAHREAPGGIVFVKSIDGGRSFTKPADVATLLCPFDQWTKGPTITSLRTNSYPTMAIGGDGVPYVAWAQRYGQGGLPNPDGQARIVFSYLQNGGMAWSDPQPVDPYYVGDGHQFMPSMTCAGGNKTVIWYDQRDDIALHDPNEKFIEDEWLDHRHTIDVRAAEAPVGSVTFSKSILLSRYLFFMQLDPDGEPYRDSETGEILLWQGQHNYSGFPLFNLGTKPFQGDYIEVTSSPQILPPPAPGSNSWAFNTDPSEPTRFHGAWTDTRDVRPPGPPGFELWGDWITYNPPTSDQDPDFEQQNPCNNKDTTGMRNQNIYMADLNHGVIVGSPGNTKQLDTQRAFVVFVKNTTENEKLLNLTIIPSAGVSASFEQFPPAKPSLVVTVLPYSSVSSTVYVEENSNLFAPVIVDVDESGALVGRVYLNPDSTNNPLLGPNGEPLLNESHKPKMSNPKIWKYNVGNQDDPNASFLSPRAQNPRAQNSGYINPRAQNPRAQNPRAQNPRAQNPRAQNENIVNNEMYNPRAQNPRAQNTALTDMTWTVSNDGNTTSAYSFNVASDSPDALNEEFENDYLIAQVLVYKTHMVPIDNECELFQTHADELIVNFTNPRAQNPRAQNVAPSSTNITTSGMSSTEQNDIVEPITFYLAPGEEAEVILRVYDPDTTVGNSFDDYINNTGGETEAEAADTGQTEPEWVEQPDAPWGPEPSYLPEIGTDPTSLSFAAVLEVNPDDQILRIYNTGGGILDYTIADDADWLSVSPPDGTSDEPDDGYDKQNHTVSVYVSGLAVGTYQGTITITDPYATNNPLRVPVTLIIAGEATQFVILDPADSTAGTTTTVTVQAQDDYGNVDTAYNDDVTLNVSGSATGEGLVDIVSGVGTASINDTVAEPVNLSLSDTEGTGLDVTSTQDVLFNPGATAKIAFDQQPTDTHANETISPAVTIEVQDTFGNLVTTATNTVAIALNDIPGGGGGTLSGDFDKDAYEGIATFDDLSVSGTGIGYTLTASSLGFTPVTSNSFNIFAKITGTVQWNGASVVADILPGTHDANIWGRKYYGEESEDPIPAANITYDDSTGVYTVTNILPADYKFYVVVDTLGSGFRWYPDNYHGEGNIFQVIDGAAVVNYYHNTQKIMRMTAPAGALNDSNINEPPINHSVPYPYIWDFSDHTYSPEITFDWEPITEATSYTYSVQEQDTTDPYYQVSVVNGSVISSSVTLPPLSPSGVDKYYGIRIMAYDGSNWIGKVIISWNGGLSELYNFRVEQPPHTITTPNIPSGPTSGMPDISFTYSTGGSECSWGDDVEYQFDWGDGNQSSWSSSTSASHSWDTAGTYNVTAQAKCTDEDYVVSAWSDALTVTINEPIFEIAYVYSTDTTTANSYKDFLEGKGYPTNLIHMNSIVTGMFADYGLILIGTDTGYTETWGDSGKVAAVNDSGKPIIGLGEGGYAFFGTLNLAIGWGYGWHGKETKIIVVDSSHDVFNTPNNLGVSTGQTISIYSATDHVGINLPTPPENVVLLGREAGDFNYYPLVQEDERYLLWGWTASPDSMTQTGKDLFENVVTWFAFFYPDFYAVDSHYDGLYIVESVSGNVTFIGPLDSDPNKYVTPIAMAVRPADGTIYVWNNSDEDEAGGQVLTGVLLTVNPSTGLATEVNPNAPNQGTLAALAFAPDGTLYGIKHDTAQELYTINLTTGVKTLVGNIGPKVYGADFYGEDLYGLTTSGSHPNYIQKLVKIDTSTGTVISEVQLDQNVGVVGSIVFDAFGRPTGSGFGGPHGRILYGIDLVSGHIFNIRQLSEEYSAQGLGLVF